MKSTTILFLAATIALAPGRLRADETPEARLRSAVDASLAVAIRATTPGELMEGLRPIAERNMSFPVMTRRAIGPGWKAFTAGQKARATELFAELLIRRYAGRFTIGQKPTVIYKTSTTPAPGRMEVPTTFFYKGNNYAVTYRIEASEGWRITDIVVEGVSIIANYRSQLGTQYQRGGATAVLEALAQAVENPG